MNSSVRSVAVLRVMLALAVPQALLSCAGETPRPHAKPAEEIYTPERYVNNLTQARLALVKYETPTAQLDYLKRYAARAKQRQLQHVAVLEYKGKTRKMQQALAPIAPPKQEAELSDVIELLTRLDDTPHTLHDIQVAVIALEPSQLPAVKEETAGQQLSALQAQWLKTAQSLPPIEDVRVQLRLARLLIQHRVRDAAYLAVDNAKKKLAALPPGRKEEVAALTLELEETEGELKQAMPFTL